MSEHAASRELLTERQERRLRWLLAGLNKFASALANEGVVVLIDRNYDLDDPEYSVRFRANVSLRQVISAEEP